MARRNEKMLKIVIWVVVITMVLTMVAALAPVFT
jgi:hypothetical protein